MESTARRRFGRITNSHSLAELSLANKTDDECAEIATELFCTPRRTQRTTQEEILVQSAQVGALSSGLKSYTWGSSGPKVLLMHGWNGRGTQLSAMIEALRETGFQVVAFDGPAHGDSPGNYAHGIMFAEAILLAQKELGPFQSVIGHSVGATAIVIAMHRGLDVPRSVLISPASIMGVANRFAKGLELSSEVTAAFIEKITKKSQAKMEEREISLLAPFLKADILVFHDQADLEIPINDSIEFVGAYPRAKLIQTNGHGHRRIIRATEVVQPSVAFLSEPL